MKWVTRERPKIDRTACPWLTARFIDDSPEFLYVPSTGNINTLFSHFGTRVISGEWQCRGQFLVPQGEAGADISDRRDLHQHIA